MSRKRHSGTVYRQHGKLWAGNLSLGYTEKKRQRRTVYGHSKEAATAKLRQAGAEIDYVASPEATTVRVAAFLGDWLEKVVRPNVRPYTYSDAERAVRLHIVPYIGHMRLSQLKPLAIEAFYGQLVEAGKSYSVRLKVHDVFGWALETAVDWGYFHRNPRRLVKRPRRNAPRRISTFSVAEAKRFLKAAKEDRLYALYVVAITTGLRMGEVFALRWDDINWEAGSISIQRTFVEISGKISTGTPKSKSGWRTLEMPPFAMKALRDHEKGRNNRLTPFVFTAPKGGLLRKTNFRLNEFYPLLERAGLKRIRFHDLRHTAATILMAEGVQAKVVAERLGHAKASTSMDLYTHSVPTIQEGAARKIDQFLGRLGTPPTSVSTALIP